MIINPENSQLNKRDSIKINVPTVCMLVRPANIIIHEEIFSSLKLFYQTELLGFLMFPTGWTEKLDYVIRNHYIEHWKG